MHNQQSPNWGAVIVLGMLAVAFAIAAFLNYQSNQEWAHGMAAMRQMAGEPAKTTLYIDSYPLLLAGIAAFLAHAAWRVSRDQ